MPVPLSIKATQKKWTYNFLANNTRSYIIQKLFLEMYYGCGMSILVHSYRIIVEILHNKIDQNLTNN